MAPIRVLQVVVSMDVGGIETMLMNYYRNIDREKVQFDFLLHCKHKSYFEDEIEALGGKIFHGPTYHPKDLMKYKKFLKDFFAKHTEYKVVHSHIKFYGLYVLKAAKKAGVHMRIAHAHTASKFYKLNATLPFRIYTRSRFKHQYTHVYACSPEAAEYVAPGAPYTIVSNAIDVKRFIFNQDKRVAARKDLGIGDDTFVVGHVGRFAPEKNHAFMLDVFSELLKTRPNSRLLFVGGGKLLEETKTNAIQMGIADKVIFAGIRQDTPDLLCAMDVFMFPSVFEGFGMVLIEAQSAGLPCFVSNTFPKAAIVSDKVKILSLDSSADNWAMEISEANTSLPRNDAYKLIINSGFDIIENTKNLEKTYLEAYGYGEW